MLIAILEDSVFRKRGREPYKKRWTARAFAYDEDGKVVFLKIKGLDAFGHRNHLETLGGGVESEETLEEALKREVREEIGYECEIVKEVGYIVDHYNLLDRETISTFFVVKLTKYVGSKRTESENDLIDGLEHISEDEVIERLNNCEHRSVNQLVQRRDKIAFEYYLKHRNEESA